MVQQNDEIIAVGKYLRLSPTKASRVLNQIRGKTYKDAILLLQFMPYRACKNIKKVLESAACNAKHNYGMQQNQLMIKQAYVNQGPTMKRFQPRAQGRAFPIHKPTCHITLTVANQIKNK